MKRTRGYFLLVIVLSIISILAACNISQPQSVKTEMYKGKALRIGMIGEIPEVREEIVTFSEIKFSDLEITAFDSQYDAIFITKNNLSEASQDKYASIYRKSNIPFFFIQTEKSFVPFIEKDLSYDQALKVTDQSYATGIIFENDKSKSWAYGLYNDIENQANIKDVYSRIFETISKNITSEANKIAIQNKVSMVTTEQLKKVTPTMTYREVIDILGESKDIGSGFFIFQYQHTAGSKVVLNFGSLSEVIGEDQYNNIQTILKNNTP